MKQKFLKAFSQVVREQITRNCEVELKGVGVFRPEHQKQFQQQYKDGRVVLVPPKDTIKFVSKKRGDQ